MFLKEKIKAKIIPIPELLNKIITAFDEKYIIVDEPSVSYNVEEIKKIPLGKSFSELLFYFIDRKKIKDSDVYNKAFIDRRTFSKIRTKENYKPSFGTITLLALALELDYEEYLELLKSATYGLPDNKREYVVIKYIFMNKEYDIQKANDLLYTICHRTIDEL